LSFLRLWNLSDERRTHGVTSHLAAPGSQTRDPARLADDEQQWRPETETLQ